MKQISSQPQLDRAVMAFRHAVTESLLRESKQLGYTVSHIEAIWHIAEQGAVSMKDLAAYLRITPPSASALVDVLTAKRLVSRKTTSGDRRAVRIVLTASGKRVLHALQQRKHSVFEAMVSKLSKHDMDEFIRILTILSS